MYQSRSVRSTAAALLVAVPLLAVTSNASAEWVYRFSFGGFGTNSGQFASPSDAAVDSNGNIFVADSARVQRFLPQGVFAAQIGTYGTGRGQFQAPGGVATTGVDDVLVVEGIANYVTRFTNAGGFVLKFGSTGNGDGQLFYPAGIATGRDGTVYVVDYGNQRVAKYSATGKPLGTFGSFGTGEGQFYYPLKIAIAPDGNVLVTDAGNRNIQEFTKDGAFVSSFVPSSANTAPLGIAVGFAGHVFEADQYNVYEYTRAGDLVHRITVGRTGRPYWQPVAVAAFQDEIFVVDRFNHEVHVFQHERR